jgi:hypothetical protein
MNFLIQCVSIPKSLFENLGFCKDSNSELPKWESIWECVSSFLHIFSHSWECECDYQVALSARTFSCTYFGCEPKAMVVTLDDVLPNCSIDSNGKSKVKITE